MLYLDAENQNRKKRGSNQSAENEEAYVELAKYISEKYSISLGKLKVGLKKYGLHGIFEKPHELGLSDEQRDELELIYILSTKNLNDLDKAVNTNGI